MNIPKVSVIVLVYKVEKYIERCVRSLFSQTMQDIEYIFVNDCTPDNSIQVLQSVIDKYPYRKPYVKIISHKKNKGAGMARNTGLAATTAPYVIFCDGDDWVEANMYESMYDKACKEDADIVMCDYYEETQGKRIYCSQNPFQYKGDIIEQMLVGKLHSSVCGALVRKSLYDDNHIQFPLGISMWEDLCTSVKLHYFAHRIAYVKDAFYHYVQYNSSLVHVISRDSVDDKINVCENIKRFLVDENMIDKYLFTLYHRMLVAKLDFVLENSLRNYLSWRNIFPESNYYIYKANIPFHTKFILWMVDKQYYNLADILLYIKYIVKFIINKRCGLFS